MFARNPLEGVVALTSCLHAADDSTGELQVELVSPLSDAPAVLTSGTSQV